MNDKFRLEEETNYWMSYSDLMASVILILVLFLLSVILKFNMQSAELEKNQLEIEQQKLLLEEQRAQIEKILGVKTELIKEIVDTLEKSNVDVKIDQKTGDITLRGNVLFEYNSHALSANGKKVLNQFLPTYLNVLLKEKNSNNISSIIIEGYTDNKGDYLYNLELSQNRALAVSNFILGSEFKGVSSVQKKKLQKMMTSNGRSSNDLMLSNGKVDPAASRRVEFKFRMKDEESIQALLDILKGGVD